ncbi:MAG: tRNA preQ1(34) S-adenosylmethionine ribosyltransferase-isomerase QueA [Chloroflexi bacterium]|nr:tRNA preQ1(34) S-adenosylmethionine ribosyltransferase-isomerase QueA [Chloroflexota bacterium]
MKISDFDYPLPPQLSAQKPAEPRDSSRLLVLHKVTGEIEHRRFSEIIEYLQPGDVLVANDTRVIPARLFGRKVPSGGKVEVLLTHKRQERIWEAMVQGRSLAPGTAIEFANGDSRLQATVLKSTPEGRRVLEFAEAVEPHLARLGSVPLPPYIHRPLEDAESYQTVYARRDGAVAAPTAGLHFTPQVLDKIKAKEVEITFITLHVGPGTFRPVSTDEIEEHQMEAERFRLAPLVAETINRAKFEGQRVIAVGTSVVRVLEAQGRSGMVRPGGGETDLFIYPGFEFKIVEALITNFHLPRSTLLMLVSAFAGKSLADKAYVEAIAQEYRFYSFGDAMLIS